MLSPPEGQDSYDKGSLDDKGRKRYLNSLGAHSAKGAIINVAIVSCSPLEERLAKLEGGRGRRRELTSKDILQSLSEARDDHMQQLVNRTSAAEGRNGPWTTPRASGSGRESPYSIRNEFADVDLGEGGESGGTERRETGVGGARGGGRGPAVKRREHRPKTGGGSTWTCCLCCRGVCREERVSPSTVCMCRLDRFTG